ncbi:hypothetical protein GOBAR_DD03891 [Gossypium barbadense]|nr:hypothetical protein GOBAR_DD03891 [Gossypium barbadense]
MACRRHWAGEANLMGGTPPANCTPLQRVSPYRALRGRVNGLGYPPDERLMSYLELARFGWSTNPGIGRSYIVPIYRLMIEQHTGEWPLLEYIQWYSSMGKPYFLSGQSIVVLSHMHRLAAYELKPE